MSHRWSGATAATTSAVRARPAEPAVSEARRMAGDEPARVDAGPVPAWPAHAHRGVAGVEAEAGDDHEDVLVVGIDGDPAAAAGFSPASQLAGDHGHVEQAGAAERVADRARAVVAVGEPADVAAAPYIGPAVDVVGGGDHLLHGAGGAGGGDRAAIEQARPAGGAGPLDARRERGGGGAPGPHPPPPPPAPGRPPARSSRRRPPGPASLSFLARHRQG